MKTRMRTQHWLGNTSTVIRRYSSLFKRRHLPLVVVIALAGVLVRPAVADTVNVNIDGINDPLLANVRNSLSVAAAKTPAEWGAGAAVAESPKCAGGDGRGTKR